MVFKNYSHFTSCLIKPIKETKTDEAAMESEDESLSSSSQDYSEASEDETNNYETNNDETNNDETNKETS